MKRILCLIDTLGPGGAQRQLVGLANFLKETGYDIIVACYQDNKFFSEQLQEGGIPYMYMVKAERKLFRLWHIARYFRKIKPDVVISYLETPSICACLAKLFNGKIKLIVSERSFTQHTGCNEIIRFNLFRLADYIVPNSYAQAQYIRNTFPVLSQKVVTVPNFVKLDFFVPSATKNCNVIPEIMVAATIWPLKNTIGLIEAVYKLKEKGYKFHVSWYGKSHTKMEYYNQCNDRIIQLGVEGYMALKDKTTQIKDCYQNADIFCLPSFFEGTPNVICEAMACGLPVLCSDVCDNSIYVTEGENGFLFNPHDVDSIVSAFERMLSISDEERVAFGQNSRKKAEEKLSKESFVQSYIKLVEQ